MPIPVAAMLLPQGWPIIPYGRSFRPVPPISICANLVQRRLLPLLLRVLLLQGPKVSPDCLQENVAESWSVVLWTLAAGAVTTSRSCRSSHNMLVLAGPDEHRSLRPMRCTIIS